MKLVDEEAKNKNLRTQIRSQREEYEKIYNELENIKYRDVSSYIIDFFICILNDDDYDLALNSTYETAVNYIERELVSDNYTNYRNMLLSEGINISDLFKVLLEHKLKYNAVSHDRKPGKNLNCYLTKLHI